MNTGELQAELRHFAAERDLQPFPSTQSEQLRTAICQRIGGTASKLAGLKSSQPIASPDRVRTAGRRSTHCEVTGLSQLESIVVSVDSIVLLTMS